MKKISVEKRLTRLENSVRALANLVGLINTDGLVGQISRISSQKEPKSLDDLLNDYHKLAERIQNYKSCSK